MYRGQHWIECDFSHCPSNSNYILLLVVLTLLEFTWGGEGFFGSDGWERSRQDTTALVEGQTTSNLINNGEPATSTRAPQHEHSNNNVDTVDIIESENATQLSSGGSLNVDVYFIYNN